MLYEVFVCTRAAVGASGSSICTQLSMKQNAVC